MWSPRGAGGRSLAHLAHFIEGGDVWIKRHLASWGRACVEDWDKRLSSLSPQICVPNSGAFDHIWLIFAFPCMVGNLTTKLHGKSNAPHMPDLPPWGLTLIGALSFNKIVFIAFMPKSLCQKIALRYFTLYWLIFHILSIWCCNRGKTLCDSACTNIFWGSSLVHSMHPLGSPFSQFWWQ
jgi:hypothetical protein